VEVEGQVIECVAPERIVFSYGYTTGQPIAPGASRVTIALENRDGSTALSLTHEFADAGVRDQHVQGWRYQLSVFGNVVANRLHAHAAEVIDRWFDAWTDTNAERRSASLSAIAQRGVRFRDRFSLVDGLEDLAPHIGAYQHFMPGMRLRRVGDIRHCQGTVIVDWSAATEAGEPRGTGINVFSLGPDARIAAVTGFWTPG